MVWGLAPGDTLKEDFAEDLSSGAPPSRNTWELMKYFLYHPRVQFGRTLDERDRGALSAAMRRLSEVYPEHEVRRAVDRFYMTRTAANHPHPALAFCHKGFQNKLFEGATVDVQDDVLLYIANGFERGDLDLPWDGEMDLEISMEFITEPGLNALVRTYPDIVSEVLTNWHDADWIGMLNGAFEHYEWLLGVRDHPSPSLIIMAEKFTVPKDFLVRSRPRKTQDRIAEAVRISRGR